VTNWTELKPSPPFYLFLPQDTSLRTEYEQACSVTKVMPVNTVGIVTGQDAATLAFTEEEACTLALRSGVLSEKVRPTLYRPFNSRFIGYDGRLVTRPRYEVMRHMLFPGNLGLIATRQTRNKWDVLVTKTLVGHKAISAFDISSLFPLYLDETNIGMDIGQRQIGMAILENRRPNLSPIFLKTLAETLKLPQTPPHGLPEGVSPEDVFHYAYAVFHSPTYRQRYAEFLKIDFPRLPLTSDATLFRALAERGAELVSLHLLEAPTLDGLQPQFCGKGDNAVEKAQYTDADHRVWVNASQYFDAVPKNIWEFHVGGYQPCQKWLKDRKGRALSYDDMQHYRKIVAALNETIRLMEEIDTLIPNWPLI